MLSGHRDSLQLKTSLQYDMQTSLELQKKKLRNKKGLQNVRFHAAD